MTSPVFVTAHAAERYVERVAPAMTPLDAIAAIHRHDGVIRAAADFGCSFLRLGDGSRLVLDGLTVVTVLSREWRRFPPRTPQPRHELVPLAEVAA